MNQHDSGRRRFIGYAALLALAPLAAKDVLAQAKAPAGALPKLPLDNAQAKALNYVESTKGLAHKTFKAGSDCANCQFFHADTKGCTLFAGFSVAPKGWCSAWAAKG